MATVADTLELVSLADRPALAAELARLDATRPAFLAGDRRQSAAMARLDAELPETQTALLDADGAVLGVLRAAPLPWSGTVDDLPAGRADALERAYARGRPADALCVVAMVVAPERRGQGLAGTLVAALHDLAGGLGLGRVLVPVVPGKQPYPLIPFERYCAWTRGAAPFDPWLRAHWRAGGVPLAAAHRATVVTGSLARWRDWTGLEFPGSGAFVVPGAIKPVIMEVERDEGRYVEPNLWVLHEAGPGAPTPPPDWSALLADAGLGPGGERVHRRMS